MAWVLGLSACFPQRSAFFLHVWVSLDEDIVVLRKFYREKFSSPVRVSGELTLREDSCTKINRAIKKSKILRYKNNGTRYDFSNEYFCFLISET